MANKFGSLKPQASAELARQIAGEPDATRLHSQGFSFPLAESLAASIKSGEIDMGAWRGLGLDQRTAVQIASAIAARHAPVAKPEPAPVAKSAPPWAPRSVKLAEPAPLRLDCYLPPLSEPPKGIQIPPRPLGTPLEPPVATVAPAEPIGELAALSLLHSLSAQISSGRHDVTALERDGFSPSTAAELAALIKAAHPMLVTKGNSK